MMHGRKNIKKKLSLHVYIYSYDVQLRPQTATGHFILTTVLNFLSQIFMHAKYKIT